MKNLKTHTVICVAICILVGVLFCRLVPRTVPLEECSEVYRRYCDMEGIRASYVKDYRVNDTLTVGVTLLEAEDSAVWNELVKVFNVSDDLLETMNADSGAIKVWQRLGPKERPEELMEGGAGVGGMDEWGYDMVAISFEQRMICIFDINSIDEFFALIDYNADVMTKKRNKIINN